VKWVKQVSSWIPWMLFKCAPFSCRAVSGGLCTFEEAYVPWNCRLKFSVVADLAVRDFSGCAIFEFRLG
jgi:hypothetical protein